MKQRICTASIFITLIAILAILSIVQHKGTVWWIPSLKNNEEIPLIVWLIPNVIGPIAILILIGILLTLLWLLAEHICEKLRKWYSNASH